MIAYLVMSDQLKKSRFLCACRGEHVDTTPIWIMRQAGRYLPEYRELRSKCSFRRLLRTPDLAAEVTLQPIKRFDLDAAIVFSDILELTEAMGIPFEIVEGKGPVMSRTVRSSADVDTLVAFEPDVALSHLLETIAIIVAELDGRIPLIGFAGAPLTLACYVVEGGSSKDFGRLRRLMYEDPATTRRLLEQIAEGVFRSLAAQIEAGVSAVQLFDTWASALPPDLYREFVVPVNERILERLEPYGAARILYVGNTTAHIESLSQSSADVIGVDWRTSLKRVKESLGTDIVVQGNLDPFALYAPKTLLEEMAAEVIDDASEFRGHVFNLGHGVLPSVDPEQVATLIERVHDVGRRYSSSAD